jgi:beta-lactamase regulating signal transducer with metallopeptidase domain
VHQSRTFRLLIGTGAVLALLLGVAVFRTVLAGCPDWWAERGLACLFLPTHLDLGTHLLSYAFIGTGALGASAGLLLWRRQWARIHSLTTNLTLLRAPEEELTPLFHRLGLKGKICIVNSKALLCFCAGFISPRIYVSRGIIAKLTPEELEALLLHEKHHLSNHVPLKILAGRCIASILFFIPLLHDLLQRYLIESEIAADRSAIWHQGHRRGIVGALEKLLQQYSASPTPASAVGAADALTYRIDYLAGRAAGNTCPIPIPRLATSLVVTILILAAILIPLPSSHPISGGVTSAVSTYLGQGISL